MASFTLSPTDLRICRLFNRVPAVDVPQVEIRRDKPFFNRGINRRFEARDDDVFEIDLYDEIGFWGVDAKEFRQALRQAGSRDIRLRINSPGGDVFDGLAMMNDLVAHPGAVGVEVSGLAASAASIVAMGGDTVAMAPESFMMIHNVWGVVVGDRRDMRAMADVAEKIDGSIARTYAAKAAGHDADHFARLMDDETWLSATDAVDEGLADSAIEGDAAALEDAARFDLSAYHHAPAAWSMDAQAQPTTKRDLERVLRDAGCSKSFAAGMVAGGFNAADGRRRDAGDADAADCAALARELRQQAAVWKN